MTNKIVERDELGRIKPGGKVLTSEAAKNIGSLPKGRKERKATAAQLLSEAGYPDAEEAPEVLRVLSEHAQKSPAGMALWLKVTDQDNGEVTTEANNCPHYRGGECWAYKLGAGLVTDLEVDDAVKAMMARRAQHDSL